MYWTSRHELMDTGGDVLTQLVANVLQLERIAFLAGINPLHPTIKLDVFYTFPNQLSNIFTSITHPFYKTRDSNLLCWKEEFVKKAIDVKFMLRYQQEDCKASA